MTTDSTPHLSKFSLLAITLTACLPIEPSEDTGVDVGLNDASLSDRMERDSAMDSEVLDGEREDDAAIDDATFDWHNIVLDAAFDSALDSFADSELDAGSDMADSASDVSVDRAPDVSVDAGRDVSVDVSTDARPDASDGGCPLIGALGPLCTQQSVAPAYTQSTSWDLGVTFTTSMDIDLDGLADEVRMVGRQQPWGFAFHYRPGCAPTGPWRYLDTVYEWLQYIYPPVDMSGDGRPDFVFQWSYETTRGRRSRLTWITAGSLQRAIMDSPTDAEVGPMITNGCR